LPQKLQFSPFYSTDCDGSLINPIVLFGWMIGELPKLGLGIFVGIVSAEFVDMRTLSIVW
jgi:hypothetical protein